MLKHLSRTRGLAVAAAVVGAVALVAAGTSAGKAPSGTPITVMTTSAINSSFLTYENIAVTAKVYGQWINSKGGINGHPLNVITCDDQNDPNKLVACGRQAVAKKVVAIVGSFTINADKLMPLLEKNNIAWFGVCCPVQNSENVSKVSFPVGAGPALSVGEGYWAGKNCKKSSVLIIEAAFSGFLTDLVRKGYTAAGATMPDPILLPLQSGDYSPQAARATTGNPDCVLGVFGESQWFAFLPALKQTGWKGTVIGPQGNLDQIVVAKTPDIAQGAVIVGDYPDISTPAFADYRAALKQFKAKTKLDYNSLGGLGTWAGYKAFTEVVKTIKGPITAATFLAAANKAKTVSTGGETTNLDFTKEFPAKGLNRVFNTSVAFDTVKDGKLIPLTTKFYDMRLALLGKTGGPAVPPKPRF